jgi:predicted Na+-dependent transporter
MVANAPKKGASAPLMARLHIIISAFAIVTVPTVLDVLSGPLGFTPEFHAGSMLWTLARTNLLPLILGLAVSGLAPAAAARLSPILHKAGMAGILVVVVLVLAKFYPTLLNLSAWSYLTIVLVSVTSLAIGYFAGADDPHERAALAIECGVRHPGLSIAIASATLTQATALPVMVPCALIFMVIATIYLSVSPRLHPKPVAA